MKRRTKATLLTLALLMSLVIAGAASGGSSSDPVVSKSYVDGAFFESVISNAIAKTEAAISSFKTKYINAASSTVRLDTAQSKIIERTASAVLERLQMSGRYLYSTKHMSAKSFSSGDKLSGRAGTVILIKSGFVRCYEGSIINITQGKEISAPNSLGNYTAYMFAENGGSIEIVTKNAEILIDGVYSFVSYQPKYTEEAYALKKLGLVRGAADGMELYRGNTRAESITMLIRLLGEEKPALSAEHRHPFNDVDDWAQKYVGYAYQKGYTKGVSENRYDGKSLTVSIQYMTFILRSLGYSEEAGDFKYASAIEDAVRLGVISQETAFELSTSEFKRDHVMHISYLAMSARLKGSNSTLLSRLVANGAVSSEAADEFLRR